MCCFEYFFPKLTTKNIWKIDNYNHWRQFYLDHRKLLTDAALSSWCKREGRDVLRTEKRNVCAWKFVGNKLLRGWYFQFSCLELEDAKGHIINLILFHSFFANFVLLVAWARDGCSRECVTVWRRGRWGCQCHLWSEMLSISDNTAIAPFY